LLRNGLDLRESKTSNSNFYSIKDELPLDNKGSSS
jgi:hypothetical protein